MPGELGGPGARVRQAIIPLLKNGGFFSGSFFRADLIGSAKSFSKIDMQRPTQRYEFGSDNTAAICPEAWAALQEANRGEASSYGDDQWTARLCDRVRELFETDCDVYLALNGTAANALSLAQLCQPFHSVICHEYSHIQTDECGAPEFFTGGSKLITVSGANGKIDIEKAARVLAKHRDLHSHKPRVVSITQSTELGTVYTPGEIARLGELARERRLFLHMDGARFANAIAHLGCAPKEITWQAGVDVLCFGGTKNGAGAGELVVFFKKDLSLDFDYRLKQGGQLLSKMRFLAAPWLALLADDVWLKNAKRANVAAQKFAGLLQEKAKIDILFPVEANAIFFRMAERIVKDLNERGWNFYKFVEPDVYRLMCSWSADDKSIDEFVEDLQRAQP